MKIGFWELIVVLIIALVVIGPDKLPEYAKALGKTVGELKKSTADLNKGLQEDVIKPLAEAQKPLKESLQPVNESVKEINENIQTVVKAAQNPDAFIKAAVDEPEQSEDTDTQGEKSI